MINKALYLHRDVFFKMTPNALILYNVYDYKNRMKMHIAAVRLLEAIDGERSLEDVAALFLQQNKQLGDSAITDPAGVLRYLVDRGFVTLSREKAKVPQLEQKAPAIDIVNLRVTNRCNFKCVHCFPNSSSGYSDELSMEEMIDIINELARYKPLHITFTGGEPFVLKKFLDLAELANSKGMIVSICTNASLINDEHISRLAKCAIGALKISLDGTTAETHDAYRGAGKFEKLLPKIRKIADAGIPVCINTIISKINFHQYRQVIDLVKDLKAAEFAYDTVRKTGRAIDNWDNLSLSFDECLECLSYFKSLHPRAGDVVMGSAIFPLILEDIIEEEHIKKACGTCLSNIVILANGDVTSCWRMVDNNRIAGNIRDSSLHEIWSNAEHFKTIRDLEISSIEKCRDCERNVFCDGSCRGFAMRIHNDWHGEPNPDKCRLSASL